MLPSSVGHQSRPNTYSVVALVQAEPTAHCENPPAEELSQWLLAVSRSNRTQLHITTFCPHQNSLKSGGKKIPRHHHYHHKDTSSWSPQTWKVCKELQNTGLHTYWGESRWKTKQNLLFKRKVLKSTEERKWQEAASHRTASHTSIVALLATTHRCPQKL